MNRDNTQMAKSLRQKVETILYDRSLKKSSYSEPFQRAEAWRQP